MNEGMSKLLRGNFTLRKAVRDKSDASEGERPRKTPRVVGRAAQYDAQNATPQARNKPRSSR
jgi:hypothetical protein